MTHANNADAVTANAAATVLELSSASVQAAIGAEALRRHIGQLRYGGIELLHTWGRNSRTKNNRVTHVLPTELQEQSNCLLPKKLTAAHLLQDAGGEEQWCAELQGLHEDDVDRLFSRLCFVRFDELRREAEQSPQSYATLEK